MKNMRYFIEKRFVEVKDNLSTNFPNLDAYHINLFAFNEESIKELPLTLGEEGLVEIEWNIKELL